MTSRIGAGGRAAALALLAGGVLALAPMACATDLYGVQPTVKAPPVARVPPPPPPQQQGGGWYQGCWNCMPPAPSTGAPGVALGIGNAPVVVGAVPPPIYYGQPPRVYLYPVPEVYVQGPVGPIAAPAPVNPRSCWVSTGPGSAGYWVSPC
ncbi:hypothetical protein [Xanthobacter agilis]|uniref:Uncharacterized protein n=1 Tax=Xanthobacter agilis TaxID=47492 RepID=A0ABU0LAA9_XANAG|nr:hypothetical protein [Xanthobacter agilis]MDQ0504063.1 hypothetical protein [Xanthobacter agilis]